MNKEINNQQGQTPQEMDASPAVENTENKVSEETNATATATQKEVDGRWEPVDPASLDFTISGDMNQPILGPDGEYYCISNSQPEYNSIQANENNAIPTPASIVQLPPIVQPIALVPFASQNQPLLQYDPNYRPSEPQTDYSPKYRLKPYRGLSFMQVLCSLAIVILLVVFAVIHGKAIDGSIIDWTMYRATGIDTVLGLFGLFGASIGINAYYDNMLDAHFAGNIGKAFSEDFLLSLAYMAIPILIMLMILISSILVIVFLIKMAQMKSPRGFNIGALINLCLSIAVIGMVAIVAKRESLEIAPGIALYAIAGISLFSIIISYFAKKNAYILDETALKRVYILDEQQQSQ